MADQNYKPPCPFCGNKSGILQIADTFKCPKCKEPKAPHRVCPNCGTYRNREVIPSDEE